MLVSRVYESAAYVLASCTNVLVSCLKGDVPFVLVSHIKGGVAYVLVRRINESVAYVLGGCIEGGVAYCLPVALKKAWPEDVAFVFVSPKEEDQACFF